MMSHEQYEAILNLGKEYLIIKEDGDNIVFTDSFINSLGRFEEALLSGMPMPPLESEESLENYMCSMAIIFHMAKYSLPPNTLHSENAAKLTKLVRSVYHVMRGYE